MLLEISLVGAFLGGTLSLLSPCSALLLPAFFAHAFKNKTMLAARTTVFLLGLLTLFLPLGFGAAWAGKLILDYRSQSIWIFGLLLILFGLLELAGIGFTIAPHNKFVSFPLDDRWTSAYVTGLVYSVAGFCSGPLLGAVLTMAAGADNILHGGLLLFMYACGVGFPLFLIAYVWDRYDLGSRRLLRGTIIRWGSLTLHSNQLVTGILFIALGLTFILSGGTIAFERLYATLGLVELSMQLQSRISTFGSFVHDGFWLLLIACIGGFIAYRTRRRGHH